MVNKKIEGLVAASLTGFHPDGSVNLEIIPAYAEMLSKNGVVGVFVNGTTGEGDKLTFNERRALAEKWVGSAPRELRVIIHVGYTDPETSRALAVHAADIGADAIGEIGPLQDSPESVQDLVKYSAATAGTVPQFPYYYYHMPSINGLSFSMIEYLQYADDMIPNLAGIKYTHDDIGDYQSCREFKNGKYDILFGRDEYLIDGLRAGAKGAVGSTYNIIAPLYNKLIKAFCAGDFEYAESLQKISAASCLTIYKSGSFGSGLKTIMRMIGLDFGGMRSPRVNLSKKSADELVTFVMESGLRDFLNRV